MLEVLGKSLFWDAQAGSDNRTACGTCYFHAWAYHRRQNQLASTPDTSRLPRRRGPAPRAVPLNRVLAMEDFPFYLFEDQNNRSFRVVHDTRLTAVSAGVPLRQFVDISRDGSPDHAADPDSLPAPCP